MLSGNSEKFAFWCVKMIQRIMIYLTIMAINFAGYVLLFSAVFGVKPAQFGDYLREKAKEMQTEIMQKAVTKPKAEPEKSEDDTERQQIKAELEHLEQQRLQLQKERQEIESVKKQIEKLKSQPVFDEDRIYNLAKIFDTMDKEKVAEIFGQMQDSLVVAILPRMKPANASQVLQNMEPARSALISKMILRNSEG